MRHTSAHTKNRRSHHALKNTNIVTDKESGALRLPHRIDETTGMYRGKQIAPAKAVKVKKEKDTHTHVHTDGTVHEMVAEEKPAKVSKTKKTVKSDEKKIEKLPVKEKK